ncbi:hypothetical protein ND973_15400 [Vibrio diabolicus]|nr:hypothetical protein [Vibrio diabolicus]
MNKARFSVVRSNEQIKEEIAKHLSLSIEFDFEEIAYVYDKQSNSFEAPMVKKDIENNCNAILTQMHFSDRAF